MPLIGTAGHIDHGKTTLIRALSGINPSRLPEEHARGMTIDLGYAHIQHPEGYTAGIVDVPGHEKLVKNMVAGATGFDIALWVVDAVEGLMPQSVEHLRIMELLAVPSIVPVITKADVATPEQIASTRAEVDEITAQLQVAAEQSHVVDAMTGRGLPQLLEAVFAASRRRRPAELTDCENTYLPVDRVFSVKGAGTVVTGTLVRGQVSVGDEVVISSRAGSWRVRSLNNHHAFVDTIAAGNRVGVNIASLEPGSIRRGDVLLAPAHRYHGGRINVRLRWVSTRRGTVKHGGHMLFHSGCAEMECRVWDAESGESETLAQIELPRQMPFYHGQRFILRGGTPLTTVGGGEVLDLIPDRKRRVTPAERGAYAGAVPGAGYLQPYLLARTAAAFDASTLATRWMVPDSALRHGAEGSAELQFRPADTRAGIPAVVWHTAHEPELLRRLRLAVCEATEHSISFAHLACALLTDPSCVPPLLAVLLDRRCGAASDWRGRVRLERHGLAVLPGQVAFTPAERRRADQLLGHLLSDGLRPRYVEDYRRLFPGRPQLTDRVLRKLCEGGDVVQVTPELVLHAQAAAALRAAPARLGMTRVHPSDFGKALGLSRKYSIPYLEYLNREGVMRRDGDVHDRV